MITENYTRSKPINQIITEGADRVIPTLLRRQATIVDRYYLKRHEPHLADVLRGNIYNIESNEDSVQIQILYPDTIRFLDLKKTRFGKKKRYYTPIYNRPLYGHVYGRGYSLSTIVNIAMQDEYDRYLKLMRGALTTIEL